MAITDPAPGPVIEPLLLGKRGWTRSLGPGLITGASDDDPSGIATYSQAGAQFGYALGWVMLFSWPLMSAVQIMSAQIGRVSGHGVAGNLRRYYPRPVLLGLVMLLVLANTINLGADLGAMADALRLLAGGPAWLYVIGFATFSLLLEIFSTYDRYVAVLKWLTLSLFAYVAVALIVRVPWSTVWRDVLIPRITLDRSYFTVLVALLGTTISPYLFFWQAEEEAEDLSEQIDRRPLSEAPEQADAELRRIRFDTIAGMGLSNLVALFIILTTAATLHSSGITDIQTSAQAAEALRPIAGQFVFLVFGLGIIGTGLLAIPVLAGSSAYALGEALEWPVGLVSKPTQARSFYSAIAVSTIIGALINLTPIDPMKALFWSAVINGVVAVPILAMMILIADNPSIMGAFRLTPLVRLLAWTAFLVMAAAAIGMIAI